MLHCIENAPRKKKNVSKCFERKKKKRTNATENYKCTAGLWSILGKMQKWFKYMQIVLSLIYCLCLCVCMCIWKWSLLLPLFVVWCFTRIGMRDVNMEYLSQPASLVAKVTTKYTQFLCAFLLLKQCLHLLSVLSHNTVFGVIVCFVVWNILQFTEGS